MKMWSSDDNNCQTIKILSLRIKHFEFSQIIILFFLISRDLNGSQVMIRNRRQFSLAPDSR